MLVVAAAGNTTCRLGLMDGTEPWAVAVFTHEEVRSGERPLAWLREATAAGASREAMRAAVCSVVPALTPVLSDLLRTAGVADVVPVRSDQVRGMEVRYSPVEALGADRLCVALGARALLGAPVIAVDCGTAITVNAVDADGRFVGGAILPGFHMGLRALHHDTALLPSVHEGDIPLLGGSTDGSIRAGVFRVTWHGLMGYVGEVKKNLAAGRENKSTGSFIPNPGERAGSPVPVVYTGGGAGVIALLGDAGWERDENLLLRGAAKYLHSA